MVIISMVLLLHAIIITLNKPFTKYSFPFSYTLLAIYTADTHLWPPCDHQSKLLAMIRAFLPYDTLWAAIQAYSYIYTCIL